MDIVTTSLKILKLDNSELDRSDVRDGNGYPFIMCTPHSPERLAFSQGPNTISAVLMAAFCKRMTPVRYSGQAKLVANKAMANTI